MNRVTSADGTPIAYERLGDGRPIIVVGGALCDREVTRPLAEELARHFAVINYDRRGRGDSGDAGAYAVEREVEDLGALIAEAGGTASVYGHSSGAGLALHAAAAGLPIARLVLHEPPFVPDREDERRSSREFAERLERILSEGRRGDAVALFLAATGMPPELVARLRSEPSAPLAGTAQRWARMEANAHTLLYDSEIMGDVSRGGTIPLDRAAAVTIPTLVLSGGESPDWMIDVGRQLAEALPNGRHRVLEAQGHVVPPEVLVPVLVDFFTER